MAVAFGNFRANSGQWKSSSFSDQALSSSHNAAVSWDGETNMCFASLQSNQSQALRLKGRRGSHGSRPGCKEESSLECACMMTELRYS